MLARGALRKRGAMELVSALNSTSGAAGIATGARGLSRAARRVPHKAASAAQWSGLCSSASFPIRHRSPAAGFSTSRKLCNIPQAAVAAPAPKIGVSPEVAKQLGFEEIREEFISEYKSMATLYKHKKTGAEVMSVVNEDENKVFGIVFRTPPKDSKGIPHILEHSVLCGSRKYPLKEPFVELLKGSLHTFLNAFTYPDRTCYPVASTNLKDFYNLVDVYLDAVFHPRCVNDPQIFQQEGWHYEVNDPSEDISYKGVVFNEMKGVYSQPESVLGRICQQELFPNNAYNVDSGGDPAVIPDLTFEEFQDFHRRFYHPSNARIWFYGDDDPTERLKIISGYLSSFEANNSALESEIQPQQLLAQPKRVKENYAVGEETEITKKHMVSMNWLLSEKPLDIETELALGFLNHLMLGTPAAPLRKTLLESHLGDALTSSGMEDDLLQPQFSIGMKGVAEGDIPKVEDLIVSTLRKLADEGFTPEAVEASMNTIEFALRENNTGSYPRGLSLMLRSVGKWLYGRDPFEPLRFSKPLEDLKAKLAKEGAKAIFSPLIEKYLLNNPHLVTVELQPDMKKAEEIEAQEKERLEKMKASMTKEDIEELARATEELKKRQETPDPPEALKAVPSLALSDIPKNPIHIPIDVGQMKDATILRHDIFTNDVIYAEVVFELRVVPAELLPLVPLFCQSLLEMGTKDMDFVTLNLLIGRKTGGISVYPSTSSMRGRKEPSSHIIIRGKAMASQTQDLFSLMRTILQDVQFDDQERFKQFVSQSKSGMESLLRGGGHRIVASRLDSMMNIAGAVGERMGGLSYLDYLRELEKQVESDWPGVQRNLEEIRRLFLTRKAAIVNLTADEKTLTRAESAVASLLDALPETTPSLCEWSGVRSPCNEGIIVPTQVNYVGKAANLYDAGYELNGSAYVISKYIGNTWLWDRVRVSGGAYGGFCDFDSHSGVFTYLSYRDPNLVKTLDNYDGTVQFLRELELDDDALTKSIIGTIGDVDSYQLPDAKGYSSLLRYMLGITEDERKLRREQILSTSLKDFKAFADVLEHVREKGIVAAVASAEDIEAANKERPGLLVPKKISL